MKNRVRIRSDENVVKNATVELLGPADEYVDISCCVTSAVVHLDVGTPSRVHLKLLTADVLVEALRLDDATLQAFAAALRASGWTVAEPEEAP